MKNYDLAALAQAPGKDLVEFIGQNEKVLAEVAVHAANLERLRGTSQAHALGYMEYMPDEITMQDFDTHLSKKGYQMSMEALHTVLLVAASAAVVAGIGLIAYKLFRAAQSKEPKSANHVEKQKQVHDMALHLIKINFTGASAPTQMALKERFLADSVKEVVAGMSDADILNNTFVAYARSEMFRSQPSYLSSVATLRGDQSLFLNAAMIYLGGVKESLENFRRDFLDVVANAPDITDYQMINLINGLKWDRIEGGSHAGVQAVFAYAQAMGTPVTNRVEETLKTALDILVAPITLDQVRAYDPDMAPATIPKGGYSKLWALLASLKETGKYIEGAKGNFTTGEKRSKQVVDLYKAQIDRASAIADSVGIIEQLARAESDAITRGMKIQVDASKHLLNAIEDVADKLEDKEAAKEIKEALADVAKATAKIMTMKTEGLVDYRTLPISYAQVMELEGRNPWMELLKSIGVAVAIGLAVYAVQALVLSMLGLQSMAASFAGGVVYMQKNGKRITPGEAADMVAAEAEKNRLGKYGVYMLSKQNALPFKPTERHLGSGFNEVAAGVVDGLRGFSGKLHGKPTEQDVVNASKAGSNSIKHSINILKGRLQDMGFKVPAGDPHVPATTHNLRDEMERFFEEWFSPEKADYNQIKRGIDTTWMGILDAKAEEHVEKNAKLLTEGITNFSKTIPAIDKEQLKAMSEETQSVHAAFTQELAYLAALGHVVTELTKKAIRDGAMAMKSVRSQLKMKGEDIGGLDDIEETEDDMPVYEESIDPLVDGAEAMADLYVDEQADVVMAQEDWKKTTVALAKVVGIVAILGAGAYLLISMSTNRRSSSSFATDKLFKDIQRDLDASLRSAEFSARMNANSEKIRDKFQDDLQRMRDAQDKARQSATQPSEKEVKGQRVDPGAATPASVHPRIGELEQPVGGSNDASTPLYGRAAQPVSDSESLEIAKKVDRLIENIGKYDYVGPLTKRLIERTPSRIGLLMATGTFNNVTDIVTKDREKRVDKLTEAMDWVLEDIISPVIKVVESPDHEAEAARIYPKVVQEITEFKEWLTNEGLDNEQILEDIGQRIAGYQTEVTGDDINRAMQSFDSKAVANAERRYISATKDYNSINLNLDSAWKDNKDFLNSRIGEKYNTLKGNRDQTSKLIRRIEEFKPTFNHLARVVKANVALSDIIFEGAEFTLRIHRSVQRELAEQIKADVMTAEEIKARLGGISDAMDEIINELDDNKPKS